MVKFLNFSNSDSGDARRHVPFASIIHKHAILLLICSFIFVFSSSFTRVKAVGFPIPAPIFPVTPYSAEGLSDNVEILNEDQKKILNEFLGTYNTVFMGFSGNLLMNPFTSAPEARSWLQSFGNRFLTAFLSDPLAAASVSNNSVFLRDLIGSATQKASTYESYNEYVTETSNPLSHSYIVYNPELTVAFKNWYAAHGGLYDWQRNVSAWTNNFVWDPVDLEGNALSNYQQNLSYIPSNHYYFNGITTHNDYHGVIFGSVETIKLDLFVNTSTNKIGFRSSDGYLLGDAVFQWGSTPYLKTDATMIFNQINFNPASYSNYVELVNYYLNYVPSTPYDSMGLVELGDVYGWFSAYGDPVAIIDHVYVGADWASRQELVNVDDLNIGANPSAYIDNVGSDAYVDITDLVSDIGSDITDVRSSVIENTLVKNGDEADQLTEELLQALDRYVSTPVSGVVVDPNIFAPFFDSGNGFINYMWYMTKPLVLFTKDLIGSFTFDPVENFSASGPGYFILGIVATGLIGGFISKCLL